MSAHFYVRSESRTIGPLEARELKDLAQRGAVSPEDLVFREGSSTWRPASRFKGLFGPHEETREELAERLAAEMQQYAVPPKELPPAPAQSPAPVATRSPIRLIAKV